MFNVTIKNLRGHARRMISTCLAVFLGVSFLCGTVILGNTITKTFKDLSGNVYSGTDAYVRSATSIKAGEGGSGSSDRARPRLPDTLIAPVRGVPGVGVSQAELQSRIQKVMPGGVEVLTGTQITKENQDSFQKRISGFGTVLSAFAWIALIVAGFVIFNTFGILFAQRAREMALLRAVGATRRQVLVSVLGE